MAVLIDPYGPGILENYVLKSGSSMSGNLVFETSNGVVLQDQNGENVGFFFATNEAVEIFGRSADNLPYPIRVDGSTFLIQSEQIGMQLQGTEIGNVLYCEAEYDINGDKIYKIGTTPIIGNAYEEEFTSTVDVGLTTSFQKVVSGTLVNSYTQANARGTASFRVENSSNSEVEVEYYITVDNDPPLPEDIFTGFVPRRSGGTNGVYYFSATDTANSNITAGQDLELYVKMVSGSGCTVTGSTYTTRLKIEETLNQTLQSFGSKIAGIEGTPTIGEASATDLLIVWDNSTKQPKIIYSRDLIAANSLECFVRGSGTNIVATTTYTALSIFDTQIDSTTTGLVKSVDDTGVTAGIPVKYEVDVDFNIEAPGNTDFTFAIFADDAIASREVHASGDGNGKFRNISFRGIADFSDLVPPATRKIDLRVKNNGDTITSISADMLVKFIS